MSESAEDIRWAHEAYYLAETGEHLGSAMQVDPAHDAATRAVVWATRVRVAREIEAARTDVTLDHGGDTTDVYIRGLMFGLDRARRIAGGDSR